MLNITRMKTTIPLLALLTPLLAAAQTESPVGSPARPFGLDIAGPVYLAGSDETSASFVAEQLPQMMQTVNENLSEQQVLSDIASRALNPDQLVMTTDSEVRVYFLSEGAGYHNTLGVNTEGTGIRTGDPKLIFPDASTPSTRYNADPIRTSRTPVVTGDFVNLGTIEAGQKLDFFLIANGANRANQALVWTANPAMNSDGIQHVVTFAVKDSAYLLIGFEDLYGGGDMDYNDIVFAVEIGQENVEALASPEPHVIFSMLAVGGVVYLVKRRRQGKSTARSA